MEHYACNATKVTLKTDTKDNSSLYGKLRNKVDLEVKNMSISMAAKKNGKFRNFMKEATNPTTPDGEPEPGTSKPPHNRRKMKASPARKCPPKNNSRNQNRTRGKPQQPKEPTASLAKKPFMFTDKQRALVAKAMELLKDGMGNENTNNNNDHTENNLDTKQAVSRLNNLILQDKSTDIRCFKEAPVGLLPNVLMNKDNLSRYMHVSVINLTENKFNNDTYKALKKGLTFCPTQVKVI